MIDQLACTAVLLGYCLDMIDRLVEEPFLYRCRDVSNEDPEYSTWICQNNVRVDLEISLAAVTDKNELALRKVA